MPRLLAAVALLAAAPALAQTDPPSDDRVLKVLDRNDVVYTVEANGDYRMLYRIGDTERTQLVWISPRTTTIRGLEVREVFSYAAEIDPDAPLAPGLADRLLRANGDVIVGAWNRTQRRLIFAAPIAADAADEDLLDLVSIVLTTADALEADLSDEDEW